MKGECRCCGNCCWFYAEVTDGSGMCAANEDWPYRDCGGAACEHFVSREDKRHYVAVLKQFNRWRCDDHVPSIYTMPDVKEITKAIDFACEYVKYFEKM